MVEKIKTPISESSRKIESVTDSLMLLEALAEMETATLSRLAKQANLSLNKTFRIILTFLELGYVERVGNKMYRLGPKVLLLGHRCAKSDPLMRIATPQLEVLSRETEEAVFLGVRVGLRQITIASWPPLLGWQTALPTQPQLPLHTSSMGLCLLAYSPEDILQQVLEGTREKFTEATLTDRDALIKAVETTRQGGYRVSINEFSHGWSSVSAPVLDRNGFACAVISIGLSNRKSEDEKVYSYIPMLRKTAAFIASSLP